MTHPEAKQVLLRYRPGGPDEQEPEVQEALQLARHDPELAKWLEQQLDFQRAVREKLRAISPPSELRERLLASRKVIEPSPAFWASTQLRIAAGIAAVIVVLGAGLLFWKEHQATLELAQFRQRMVGTVLRQYAMDLRTPDLAQLRKFHQGNGAPADYEIPAGLQQRELSGGGLLKWQNHPVSMVCFDRGDKQMLYLFVMDQKALKTVPTQQQVLRNDQVVTVCWSKDGKTYLLAGPAEEAFAEKYL